MFLLVTPRQTAKHTRLVSDKATPQRLVFACPAVTAMPIAPAIPNACSPHASSPPHVAMTPFAVPIASASKRTPTTFSASQHFMIAAMIPIALNQPIAPLANASQTDPVDRTQNRAMFPFYFKNLKKKRESSSLNVRSLRYFY
jgi:hypothetical protein